ncbi:MAG: hypothetical protein KGZ63_09310 [Clostridiales bacterium]|jgi:hypothetical protein|nr:hypothetical protein [Clostridiales bacterium]
MKRIISLVVFLLVFTLSSIALADDYFTTNGYYQANIYVHTATTFDTAEYYDAFTRARNDWNSTSVPRKFYDGGGAPYSSVVYARFYEGTWSGMYSLKSYNNNNWHRATSFHIYLNRRSLDNRSFNFKRGVAAHEIGHAYALADHWDSSPTSIMSRLADLDFMVKPQDIDISRATYAWTFLNN